MCHGAGIEDEPLGPGDVNRPNGLGKMPPHKAPVGAASTSSNGNSSSSSNSAPTSNGAPSTNGAAPAVATAAAAANVGGGGGRGTPKELGCRLLLDCMGHYSDITVKGWKGGDREEENTGKVEHGASGSGLTRRASTAWWVSN
eukprot:scaffold141636_cov19-Tisochrysis_lutea.AAC.1